MSDNISPSPEFSWAEAYDKKLKEMLAKKNPSLMGVIQPGQLQIPTVAGTGSDRVTMGPRISENFTQATFISRVLGHSHRFRIQLNLEKWSPNYPDILTIALLDLTNGSVVRFEEDPNTFPSDAFIDKLRLLR